MRYHRSNNDFSEEQIFLGGQVSQRHERLKTMAMLDADTAGAVAILDHLFEVHGNKEDKVTWLEIRELMVILGQAEMLRNTSELTRLSMILGDTRQHNSAEGLSDKLRQLREHSGP